MKKIDLVFLSILIPFNFAYAEIKEVIIRWNALTCLDICTPGLEANLRSIKGALRVEINPRGGIAVIGWDPNRTFSYEPFNLATRGSGVRSTDIRLKVAGTITHDASGFYLTSVGDFTRFLLIGPISTQSGRYTINTNIANHPLPPDLQEEFIEAEINGLIVTVEGPLFEPWTYYLNLVADHVSIAKPKDDPRLKY